jgi:hypothetical protein
MDLYTLAKRTAKGTGQMLYSAGKRAVYEDIPYAHNRY